MAEKENGVVAANAVNAKNEMKGKRDFSDLTYWSTDVDEYVIANYKVGDKVKVNVISIPVAGTTEVELRTVDEKLKGVIELEELDWNLHNVEPDFKVGDTLELTIKAVNKVRSRIEFTRLEGENPWGKYMEFFKPTEIYEGKVTHIGTNGVIVHLDYNGTPVEAFLSTTTLKNEGWFDDVIKVGETLKFKLLSINKDKREIFLTFPEKENEVVIKKSEDEKSARIAKESEEIKKSIKTKYINVDFVYDLMSVPTYSRNERRMQLYIINWARQRGIDVEYDAKGNLYLTKGKLEEGEVYPCVTSHMDTVQEKALVYSDAAVRLEIVTDKVKVYTDKDKEFYGGDYKTKISVDGQGIGADCKAGIVICLSLMDKFDKMKAAFFVEEEIGMLGSKAMNPSFFDDCGYCIGWDSPDLNRAAYKSSGTKLFSAEFYKNYLKPICQKWGMTDFRSEPFTDIINIREKSNLMCMNFGNGGYEAHMYSEYCIVEDMDHALGMGIDIVEGLGNKLYKSLPKERHWQHGKLVGEPENNMIKEGETGDDTYFTKEFNKWGTTYGSYSGGSSYGGYSGTSSSGGTSTNKTETTSTTKDNSVAVKYIIETYDAYLDKIKKQTIETLKKFCEDNGLDYEEQLSSKIDAVYSKEITF